MAGRRRKGKDMRVWSEGNGRLLLRGLHETVVLLGADAVLGESAPFDAGRAHGPGIDMAALFARRIRLIGPDLHLLAALLAPDILRLRCAYL